MRAFVVRRLLQGIPVVLGVTLISFLLFRVFGGDPVAAFLGKNASPAEVAAYTREYGLDRSLGAQYLDYLARLFTLDLGRSFSSRRPVIELLADGVGPSLCLTLPALFFGTLSAVSLALLAARARGRVLDRAIVAITVLGTSVSVLAYIVVGQWLLAFVLPLFPIHGWAPGWGERWAYLALPTIVLVVVGLGHDTLLYRGVMIEELGKDYVLAARARGVSERRVLFAHVLRGAAGPIVTRVAGAVPFLVTGSLLLESYFGIPGLGTVLVDALDHADLPVLEAYVALVSILFVLANLAADLVAAALDPRVRLGGGRAP